LLRLELFLEYRNAPLEFLDRGFLGGGSGLLGSGGAHRRTQQNRHQRQREPEIIAREASPFLIHCSSPAFIRRKPGGNSG
jgi:hypothetical protein